MTGRGRVTLLATGLLLLAACSKQPDPLNFSDQIGQGRIGATSLSLDAVAVAGGIALCVHTDQPARILAVEPVQVVGSIQLNRVGFRTFPNWPPPDGQLIGGAPGRLPSEYKPVPVVIPPCRNQKPGVVFLIEASRIGPQDGGILGLRFTYTVGTRLYQTVGPYDLVLCGSQRSSLEFIRQRCMSPITPSGTIQPQPLESRS